jgi:hypothetical protein
MHPLIEEDTIQSKLFPELDFYLRIHIQKMTKPSQLKGFVLLKFPYLQFRLDSFAIYVSPFIDTANHN